MMSKKLAYILASAIVILSVCEAVAIRALLEDTRREQEIRLAQTQAQILSRIDELYASLEKSGEDIRDLQQEVKTLDFLNEYGLYQMREEGEPQVIIPAEEDPNPPTGNPHVVNQEKTAGTDMLLPDLPTDRKVCTDYRFYNIPGTPHNRMQLAAYTDEQGCRRYGEYYIVGLGSAYANRVGETFEVELNTGVIFTIITGDMKPDDDTDITNRFEGCYNYDGAYCANILEFIIDKETFDTRAYQWGGVDWYENFKGDIVRLTYLGRDESADWDIYT